MREDQSVVTIWRELPREKARRLLLALTHPVPSTKGMGPSDRANLLHAEMERRIARANEALAMLVSGMDGTAAPWREVLAITEATHTGKERAYTALSLIDCIAREALRHG